MDANLHLICNYFLKALKISEVLLHALVKV